MRLEFRKCLDKRKISRFPSGPKLARKELRSALSDLEDSRIGLATGRSKWPTIQAYYAMYHAARALVYSKGFREHSHYCLMVALQELYVDQGQLEPEYIDAFFGAMKLRESADYRDEYSSEKAVIILKKAEEFINKATRMLLKIT